jgi:hypothetical protein
MLLQRRTSALPSARFRRRYLARASLLVTLLFGVPAMAQQRAPIPPAAADAPEAEGAEIVVSAERQRAAVPGPVRPDISFSAGDVRALGVSSVSELLAEIAPQTGSGSGSQPVVLLEGRRIASMNEIRDLPAEAIQRVDVLPGEAALRYGYRADQKVVNIVLRQRFRATTAEAGLTIPTGGGMASGRQQVGLLHIRNGGRLNVALTADQASMLTEAERGLAIRSPRRPYALTGNVTAPVAGAEIDPALSALAGRPVAIAAVPEGPATLEGFVSGADQPATTDTRRWRSLLPEMRSVDANLVYSRPIGDVHATFNAQASAGTSRSRHGLAAYAVEVPGLSPQSPFAGDVMLYRYAPQPLEQTVDTGAFHLGFTFDGHVGQWQWQASGTYDHAFTRTEGITGIDVGALQRAIDTAAVDPFDPSPAGADRLTVDRATATTDTGDLHLLATGSLFALPAGPASASVAADFGTQAIASHYWRDGIPGGSALGRDSAGGQLSLDLPLTSRRYDVLAALGDLSVNANAGYTHLSDVGGQRVWGAGATWSPLRPIGFNASYAREEGAPSPQDLGAAVIATSGVRIFDFARGETVDVTRLSGGNPALRTSDRRLWKLQAVVRPLDGLDVTAEYRDSATRHAIAALPAPTPRVEQAFPDRFVRNADGALVQVDARPVNFDQREHQSLRYGFTMMKRLGEGAAPGGPQPAPDRPAGTAPGRAGAPPPGLGAFRRDMTATRVQFSFYHTLLLADRARLTAGGPVVDLLHGGTLDAPGGSARHKLQAQAGISRQGIGARLTGNWQSGTSVDGANGPAGRLSFSDLATIDLRLFANLGMQRPLVEQWPALRGVRIGVVVNNLFNDRMRVTDATGTVPLGYQGAYLDPMGRSIRFTLRKLFVPPRPAR